MASLKRGSDDDSEGPVSKMANRDEDDDGGKSSRSSRVRKKSAKVLEMEEFEEIEKKQFTKKDAKGKGGTPASVAGGKKTKTKGEQLSSPAPASDDSEMMSPGAGPMQDTGIALSPVKASTKQAVWTKVSESQGSVIKLLLSSPAIPSAPSISTNVITKTSPPASVSCSATSIAPAATPPSSKKSPAKIKTETLVKEESGVSLFPQEEEIMTAASVKTELMDTQQAHFMQPTSLSEGFVASQPVIKSEPGVESSDGLSSLKVKLLMSPKDIEAIIPTSTPIRNVSGETPDEQETTPSLKLKVKGKAGKSLSSAKKKAAPKRKKPAGEKGGSGKQQASKSAAEQMPNLAALVSTPKIPKIVKEERNLSMSDGMDTSMSDTSLDMSNIVESALDMEEEAALVIAEGNAEPSKPKKKRAGGGKKKLKLKAQAAMDLPGGFDSDEGMSVPPEGDLATLAAKVQRSIGGVSGKKKALKKTQEMHDIAAQEKKKRPSRRTPTAYMLYCNSQRPKVVAESPGIDFAQISRTLGVMWQCLSKKEKLMWRRKSKKLAGKGSTLISTGKGTKKDISSTASASSATASHHSHSRLSASSKASKASAAAAAALSPAAAGEDTPQSPVKGFGIEPIDVAAHLKLLGESLSIIGNRLQEHKGLIAVQGSLSVLLDSLLCACGPLLALAHQVPCLDGCSEATHARTLDCVAYVMPGL